MKRVYVAGPYSGPDVLSILGNMRKGMEASNAIFALGYAPFAPWLDYYYALMSEHPLGAYYEASLAWLEVSDCVVMLDGWHLKEGCKKEFARAMELDVPIYWYPDFIKAHNEGTLKWRAEKKGPMIISIHKIQDPERDEEEAD